MADQTSALFDRPVTSRMRDQFEAFRAADVQVISHGMGVDSTGLILKVLDDPDAFGVDLTKLVVQIAILGAEFEDTNHDTETHLFPLLRANRVRTVQVARTGPSLTQGITVLSDTRAPMKVFTRGPFTLRDEMRAAGTVPQAAGGHTCSQKHKARVLDQFGREAFPGAVIGKCFGYNADEGRRAKKSNAFQDAEERRRKPGQARITLDYPLVREGVGRREIETYVADRTGTRWRKSHCSFCPFSGVCASRDDHMDRLRMYPKTAAEDLELEYTSLALNEHGALYVTDTLFNRVTADGNAPALGEFATRLDKTDWAVLHVRRSISALRKDSCDHRTHRTPHCWLPSCFDCSRKGTVRRSTRTVTTGSRSHAAAYLRRLAADKDRPIDRTEGNHAPIDRIWLRRRDSHKAYPKTEEFYTVVPLGVEEKQKEDFEEVWHRIAMCGRPA